MKTTAVLLLSILLAGCSPLTMRLNEEEKKEIDGMWDNMLTPVDRLDHGLLLDVMCAYQLHSLGVDTLHATAVKHFKGGKVIIEIDCDRADPDGDQFTVTIQNTRERTVRRERYSRSEVESRSINVESVQTDPVDKDGKPLPETPERRERRVEAEARLKRIEAATQPARL